jgi:hypothetical protein
MDDSKFKRNIFRRLRREFSEAEAVKLLNKRLKELEIELGIIKSERDEAIDLREEAEQRYKEEKSARKEIENYKRMYFEQVDLMREQRMKIKELDAEIIYLLDKIY